MNVHTLNQSLNQQCRTLFAAALSLVLIVVAASCSKEENPPAAGGANPATPTAKKAPDEVRLAYFANLTHAQAVLGVSSGEFAKAIGPSKLSTKVFNAGPSLIEAMVAGHIDIAYVGPGPAINAHLKSGGKGIRVVGAAASNGVTIVVRGDSDITTLAGLAGKTVATPQIGNTQDLAARHYMLKVLKQPDANNVRPIANAEQSSMIERKQIDAVWAPEPWASRLVVENGARVLANEEDLWPNKEVTLTLIVTTPEFLAEHPDVVEKMLGVSRSWTKRLSAEPDKYLGQLGDALRDLSGKGLPPGVLEMAIKRVKFTDRPLNETLDTFAVWTYELGFVRQPGDAKGLVDTTILDKLEKQ